MGDSHTSKSYFSNPQGESNGCPRLLELVKQSRRLTEIQKRQEEEEKRRRVKSTRRKLVQSRITDYFSKQCLETVLDGDNNSKISNSQDKVCLSLDNLSKNEMKLILPLLSKKDLKSLRLVSKRCAKDVILYDKRMQKWNISVDDDEQIYNMFKKSIWAKYFPYLCFKLSNKKFWSTPKKIIELLSEQIVELDLNIKEYEIFLADIRLPNLTKLRVEGHEFVILQNKSISKTVKSLSVTNSEELEEYEVENIFPELQNLCLKDSKIDCNRMISQNLYSLIILEQRNIDIGPLPILPNLKVLMVDHTTVKLIYKCVKSLEYLIFEAEFYDDLVDMYDNIQENLIFPKLKHLAFGQHCYPMTCFVTQHKATLETLIIRDLYPGEEYDGGDYNVFMGIKRDHDEKTKSMIKKWMNECQLLKILILPRRYAIQDETGRVKVYHDKEKAVKILKHICKADYNVIDDGFIEYVFPDFDFSKLNIQDPHDDSLSNLSDDSWYSDNDSDTEDKDPYSYFNHFGGFY